MRNAPVTRLTFGVFTDWIETLNSKYIFWVWSFFFGNLFLRADGHFPFPKSVNPELFRAVVILQTLFFAVSGGLVLSWIFERQVRMKPSVSENNLLAMIGVSVPAIFFPDILQAKRFAAEGYVNRFPILIGIFLVSVLLLASLWKKNRFFCDIVFWTELETLSADLLSGHCKKVGHAADN